MLFNYIEWLSLFSRNYNPSSDEQSDNSDEEGCLECWHDQNPIVIEPDSFEDRNQTGIVLTGAILISMKQLWFHILNPELSYYTHEKKCLNTEKGDLIST